MPASSPPDPLVGAVLSGRWRIDRLLGEGGMGAVYAATGVRGEGARAVKLLHPEFHGNEQVVRRFVAEAQTAQRLVHGNIARVFELAQAENGAPYIVMELLEGTPLQAYIQPGVQHPPEQAVPILLAILAALAEAHRQGVVHRDLKPDNVFLARDPGGRHVVKLLDFGIAKVMDAAGGMGARTRTGMLLGTPGYMSPEQLRSARAVDPRTDLWAAAVVLHEMLVGDSPFPAPNEMARLTAVLTEEPAPIDAGRPHLAPWRPFFARALAKDPTLRFRSADEMAEAAAAIARGVSPHASTVAAAAEPPPASLGAAALSVGPAVSGPRPGGTQASAYAPPGAAPTYVGEPSVQVVSTPSAAGGFVYDPATDRMVPRPTRAGVPVWAAVVIGIVCLVLGFVLGHAAP